METSRHKQIPKNPVIFTCDKCCFVTRSKKDYNRHLMTRKHIKETSGNAIYPPLFACDKCSKSFNTRSGLWKHRNKCKDVAHEQPTMPREQIDSSLVIELLKQNQEFKEMMMDQHKKMTNQQQKMVEQQDTIIELSKNTGNTTNNNTIHNTTNKFNLNLFLNETCKDAINLNDFIQSIELTLDDFVKTGELGYVKGISNIMLERIRDMEPHVRPIHCTDLKRETVYIKDSDKWSKEDETKTHLRKAVKIVANKNKNQVHSWIAENPQYDVLDTPECDKFFEYSKVSLGGYGKEEGERYDNKIISNVLKEVILDKENIRM